MRTIVLLTLVGCFSWLSADVSVADDNCGDSGCITMTDGSSPNSSEGGSGEVQPEQIVIPKENIVVPDLSANSTITDANGGGSYSGGRLADPAQ